MEPQSQECYQLVLSYYLRICQELSRITRLQDYKNTRLQDFSRYGSSHFSFQNFHIVCIQLYRSVGFLAMVDGGVQADLIHISGVNFKTTVDSHLQNSCQFWSYSLFSTRFTSYSGKYSLLFTTLVSSTTW